MRSKGIFRRRAPILGPPMMISYLPVSRISEPRLSFRFTEWQNAFFKMAALVVAVVMATAIIAFTLGHSALVISNRWMDHAAAAREEVERDERAAVRFDRERAKRYVQFTAQKVRRENAGGK